MSRTYLRTVGTALTLALASIASASAATLIVIDARGGALKPGQKIDSATPLSLKEGERVTVIGPDGKATTLRGPFSGVVPGHSGNATEPRMALAALIATRNARTNSVGVIRSGTNAAPLPDPWLIDVTRSGERCLKAGTQPVWWRPLPAPAQSFVVMPIDRSWRADLQWQAGQQQMSASKLVLTASESIMVVRSGDQEFTIRINPVRADLDNDLVLVSWMLEKGCMQQADALLRQIRHESQPATDGGTNRSTPAAAQAPGSQQATSVQGSSR